MRIQSLTKVYDKVFAKQLNTINIFVKLSILDVYRNYEYASMS